MNLSKQARKVRLEMASELTHYAKALESIGLNTVPIYNSINLLQNENKIPQLKQRQGEGYTYTAAPNIYECNVENFIIELPIEELKNKRHIRPSKVEFMELIINSQTKADCKSWGDGGNENPFLEMSFKVSIRGFTNENELSTGWHFDLCNPYESKSNEVHPTYHAQASNDDILDGAEDFLLSLDIPRLFHPPLDFILGVDYMLANFAPNKRKQLCETQGYYRSILERYQKLIWQPFFYKVANYWDNSTYPNNDNKDNWHPHALLPQLKYD